MTHQLNVTHSRSDALNHLTITHNRTFNGKPLYYFEDGLVLEYLEEIDRVLTEALNQYPRVYAVHINLNLPSDLGNDYLAVFAHFFRILESETNELCRDKYTDRTYQYQQTVIRYIWAKASESTSEHHHLMLLFDRVLFQSFGTGREGWGRFLYKKVRKTWDRGVEANYSQPCSGLAYSPTNEGFELFSDTETFPLQLNEFFYRISRLAKPIANRNDHHNKSFGCSHNSP
ncbi:inovirus Gp2 family protein [Vibrio anguillarum]|nr:inovirus Gp2 family protein [Vibrio anguillarum]MBF4254807.1 inovirus Gp2 family protein [Vibrio anguillarum]MBF4279448.1 inovirus Gp2 family protein [Vibrio anguillarum]MBF4297858.1 inovirus Gp2 family protein [Vibrio anguillarum]MBF4398046.1 inovirus Gp2 family protein [Vibrio anguillarum]MBF4441374.1 inovirus Gp2 family protein [Vibrio anguillarum]